MLTFLFSDFCIVFQVIIHQELSTACSYVKSWRNVIFVCYSAAIKVFSKYFKFFCRTCMEVYCIFFIVKQELSKNNLLVKVHLSLHYTNEETRKEWMPLSLAIKTSISALEFTNFLLKFR